MNMENFMSYIYNPSPVLATQTFKTILHHLSDVCNNN